VDLDRGERTFYQRGKRVSLHGDLNLGLTNRTNYIEYIITKKKT